MKIEITQNDFIELVKKLNSLDTEIDLAVLLENQKIYITDMLQVKAIDEEDGNGK